MKTAVIYSSKTGNTRKIAEAIRQGMPPGAELYAVENAPPADAFDLIVMGFWVDKGRPDPESADYMKTVKKKKVITFFTLGAYPDSPHAEDCLKTSASCYGAGCDILGSFRCQGAIDPKLIQWMEKLPGEHPHAPDEARRKRWADAATHPDQADLADAAETIRGILTALAV